jgi:competence protein ComEC
MGAAWFGALVPVAAVRRGPKAAGFMALLAVVALVAGVRFGGWYDRPSPDLVRYTGRDITVEGHIDSDVNPGETTASYRVAVDHVQVGDDWAATSGKVLAIFDQYAEYLPGDHVVLTGKIEEPPVYPDFDYRGYLARSDVVATMYLPRVEVLGEGSRWEPARGTAELRGRLDASLQRSLPEPEASLAAGIAFGRDGNMPDTLYADFRSTGLAHIVAVSGSNVSIVAAMVFALFIPVVGRRAAAYPAAVTVVAYLGIAGLSGSVVRAGIMAMVFLAGEYLGRQQSALAALGAAAILMTAVQPASALDLGFQLSLAATAGLIVFGPWVRTGVQAALRGVKLEAFVPEVVGQTVAFSLSASIATLPVVWTNFGQVSLVGPLANVVIEPLFVVAFWLSALTAFAGLVSDEAARHLGLVAYLPLSFITWFARTAANAPGAAVDLPRADGEWAMAAYAGLALLARPAYLRLAPHGVTTGRKVRPPRRVAVYSAGLAAATVFAMAGFDGSTTGDELEVTALDVGQGDAILVTTPNGHRWLFDGGPSGIVLARELGTVLRPSERTISRVFLTHPQQDHIGGFPTLLRRYDVQREADTGVRNSTHADALYLRAATHRTVLTAGDAFEEDGVRLDVLWPPAGFTDPEINDTSMVVRLKFGDVTVLLTGDIEAPALAALMEVANVRADVLKVPHHGSKTTGGTFLAAAAPRVAVISVGAKNQFGHPADETLGELSAATILRTDLNGRVTIRTDGYRLTATRAR